MQQRNLQFASSDWHQGCKLQSQTIATIIAMEAVQTLNGLALDSYDGRWTIKARIDEAAREPV